MHIELRHLRTVRAIHEAGGLARAAEALGLTQSALSHQVRFMEEQAGTALFVRASKPLRLSPAGRRLLAAADAILPQVAALEAEFEDLGAGRTGRMHVALECHACFDWLLPVLDEFRRAWPAVDIDIRAGLAFDALPSLRREEVDLVVSADPAGGPDLHFAPLFDYEPVLVCAASHPLAALSAVSAGDLKGETLIAYPVDRDRLDAFTELLRPAAVEPAAVRPVELTAMILLLVAAGRGVAVLPDWVVRAAPGRAFRGASGDGPAVADLVTRPLARPGGPVLKRLYAATRAADAGRPHVAHLVRLARREALRALRP